MKKFLLIFSFMAALMFTGCQKEKCIEAGADDFTVSFEGLKTSLSGTKVTWNVGDEISINGYKYTAQNAGETAVFKAVSTPAPAADLYVAVYPSSLTVDGTVITGSLPADQTAKANGIADGLNYAVAKSSDHSLTFKNIFSLAKVMVNADAVNSISITSGDAPIVGDFAVNFAGENPVVGATGEATKVTLNGTFTKGSTYCLAMIPSDPESFVINFALNSGSWSREKTTSTSFARNEQLYFGSFIFDPTSGTGALENAAGIYVKASGSAGNSGESWDAATTLDAALAKADAGDVIYVAAGSYVPAVRLTNGTRDNEITFEIKKNFTVMGGFPASATGTDLSGYNPGENVTTFNGTSTAYHVVTVTAPVVEGRRVVLKGITITKGKAAGSYTTTVNGTAFKSNQGGNVSVGLSAVDFVGCTISSGAATYGGGVYLYPGADALFEDCTISSNTATSNCAGIYNSSASLTANRCAFTQNVATQVAGAIMSIGTAAAGTAVSKIYNSYFTGNDSNTGNGIYAREFSKSTFVNSTFSGNKMTKTSTRGGGAVALHGTTTGACVVNMISCTVTDNYSKKYGGGVYLDDEYSKLYAYNCIFCGNNATGTTHLNQSHDVFSKVTNYSNVFLYNCVNAARWYNESNTSTAKYYFHYGMFSDFEKHGNTMTAGGVQGDGDQVFEAGSTLAQLVSAASSVDPEVPADIVSIDQCGLARTGSVLGADITPRTLDLSSKTSTTLGKKVYGANRNYFTSFTDGNFVNMTDGIIRYDWTCHYMDEVNGEKSSLIRRMFLFEVDLSKATLLVGLPDDDNTKLKNSLTQVKTQLTSMRANRTATYDVLGGVNGDFFETSSPYNSRGPIFREGVKVQDQIDSDATVIVLKDDNTCVIRNYNGYAQDKEGGFAGYKEAIGARAFFLQSGKVNAMTADKEPRTCFGVNIDKNKAWILVVDGRSTTTSNGATYNALGRVLVSLGAYNAVNLDGGSSSTFDYWNGSSFVTQNDPSGGSERKVANCLCVAKAK